MTTRHDGRAPDELREIRITRNWLDHAEGSLWFVVVDHLETTYRLFDRHRGEV